MDDVLLQLGVGGVFAILVIKEVFAFIKVKRNGDKSKEEAEQKKLLWKMAEQVRWLKDVHDQKDRDGVYAWYVRRSLEEAIEKLSDNIAMQTKVFEALVTKLDMVSKE